MCERERQRDRIGAWSLDELMRAGDLPGTGPIGALERRLAAQYGRRHALCVASATAGLHALAVALDLGGGEVVTSPYAWGAGCAAVLAAGGGVRFADIDPLSLTLDPERAAAAVGPRTRALLSTDTFGIPSDSRALRAVADARSLWLIHDGAPSFGAVRDARPPGAWAHAVVLSLAAGKALGAGEGGAILTDDEPLHRRLVALTQHPLRQRLELGLGLGSELAVHARIHPVAAAWALERFDAAVAAVRDRQERGLELLRHLDGSGLCAAQEFAAAGILPSFHRHSAAWRGRPAPRRLERYLAEATGARWRVAPSPVGWIPRDRLFPMTPSAAAVGALPVAARQLRRRIVLLEEGDRGSQRPVPPSAAG
ncbi:MAG: DegT/DnrJ/EryC1/StrS family aminotransferase [Thermoanaerobaculia bacterium]|nr:DegT/DnrJ/EryC1/StrS family aminotransferase [Thermoanaerobaculia bacterium]